MRFVTTDAAGRPTGFYDDGLHEDIPAGAVEITDEQYGQWIAEQHTLALVGGELVAIAAPAATPIPSVAADLALTTSDRTILRCTEAGVPVPAAWRSYREALRAIKASGTLPAGGMPVMPAYPAGT